MNDTYTPPVSTRRANKDGLPRDGRKLKNTVAFSEAIATVDATLRERGHETSGKRRRAMLEPGAGKAVGSGKAVPDSLGRDEPGLQHEKRRLQNVKSFEAILDDFSKSAADQGELPIAIEIGAKLRTARLEKGMTQSFVAEQAGVLQSVISDIEKGKGRNGPNCYTVQKIAAVLGLRIELVSKAA